MNIIHLPEQTRALVFDIDLTLYAGGMFTSAGGISVKNIAKWDGTTWSAIDEGLFSELEDDEVFYPIVSSLVIDDSGNLYTAAENRVVKWDGTSWSALSPNPQTADGRRQYTLYPLLANGSIIYAVGSYRQKWQIFKWE